MKKILILGLIPLLIGGVVVALAMMHVINIPGLTPKKKKPPLLAQNGTKPAGAAATADPAKPDDSSPDAKGAKKSDPPPADKPKADPPKKATPVTTADKDPDKGASKLASVWAEMKPDDLLKILPKYKDAELAPVLKKMDEAAVAELLAKMDPARAASLSRAIEASASELKPAPPAS